MLCTDVIAFNLGGYLRTIIIEFRFGANLPLLFNEELFIGFESKDFDVSLFSILAVEKVGWIP
jgi:hypothetical protein